MALQHGQRIAVGHDGDGPGVAGRRASADLDQRGACGVHQLLADAKLPGRADHRLPRAPIGTQRLEQQHFGGASAEPLQPQPGRDDLGVVDHQQITVGEQRRKIANVEVSGLGTPPVDQQPRCVAGFDRHLGDAVGR